MTKYATKMPEQPMTSYAIARADAMLLTLYAIISAAAPGDEDPRSTLLDQPEVLRKTMVGALCDLRHLAGAAGISWEQVQIDAQEFHERETRESAPRQ